MSQKFYCPYCDKSYYEEDFRDYNREEEHEIECGKCEKIFVLKIEEFVEYNIIKRCSLNDEKHSWRDIGNDCVICDECKYVELKKNAEGWKG